MSMNTEPHPTPDTDAFVLKWQNADPARALVELTELHRSKERELSEARAQARMDVSEIRRQFQKEWDEHRTDEEVQEENRILKAQVRAMQEAVSGLEKDSGSSGMTG